MKTQYIYLLLLLLSTTITYSLSYKIKNSSVEVKNVPTELDYEILNNKIKIQQPSHKLKLYDFSYIVRPNSKRWRKLQDGTYQNSKFDVGNINSKGEFVGTNRSIAAKTYEEYTGKKATFARMRGISYELAKNIYRDMFWYDIMKGHKMKVRNPLLLDMIFNAICSSNGTIHFKSVLQEMTGFKSNNWKITEEEIIHFNNLCKNPLKEAEFYSKYWNIRNEYYALKSKKRGHRGLNRWIDDYDKNAYKGIIEK